MVPDTTLYPHDEISVRSLPQTANKDEEIRTEMKNDSNTEGRKPPPWMPPPPTEGRWEVATADRPNFRETKKVKMENLYFLGYYFNYKLLIYWISLRFF